MQKKKIGHILFTAAVMGICVLPTVVMPWQKAESVGNEQLAELPELLDEDGKFSARPDVLFIDGGAEHASAACTASSRRSKRPKSPQSQPLAATTVVAAAVG